MEKSKYIKPQCEDIFLVKGESECGPGSNATGPPPGGCKPGSSAAGNCVTGTMVALPGDCTFGAGQRQCLEGQAASDCSTGGFAGDCSSGAGVN